MPSAFTIKAPPDYHLARDVCSYGYFLLAPNHWAPDTKTFTRTLDLPGGPTKVAIWQEKRGAPLRVEPDRRLGARERAGAERMIGRMLQLTDPGVREFHRLDPRWKRSGRGRLFRSPTFFEDLIKTVTSCNVAWPSTVRMNTRLCEAIHPAFPGPERLARVRPATLRARCGVGYRDKRIVELSRLATSGEIDAEWFEDPSNADEAVFEALLALPGLGPYSAGNVMQLLGRYSRLAIDTETVRHGRDSLGMKGTGKQVERRLEAHYRPFGEHRFRSYWFELWAWYEARRGPAWTWERERVGDTFTAAKWRQEAARGEHDLPPERAAPRRPLRRRRA